MREGGREGGREGRKEEKEGNVDREEAAVREREGDLLGQERMVKNYQRFH